MTRSPIELSWTAKKGGGGARMAEKIIIEGDGMLENERFLLNSNSTYDCLLIAPQDRG